jgi:acyl carrier protein
MIEVAVRTVLSNLFGLSSPEAVDLDASLAGYDADSLDLIELIMGIEDALEFDISDAEARTLGTNMHKITGRSLVELATKLKGV